MKLTPQSAPFEGAKRSEDPKNGAGRSAPKSPSPRVSAKPQRRRFSAEYKARIVEEAEALPHGQQAALLRREGLYSSQLGEWRKLYQSGGLQALKSKKRGPEVNPALKLKKETERLERENARLKKKLRQAELIIEIQKKVARMMDEEENENSL